MRTLLVFAMVLLVLAVGTGGGIYYYYLHPVNTVEAAQQSEKAVTSLTNSLGMKLVKIPAGKFVMGSPAEELHRESDETQHEVALSKDFWIGVHEVTQGQYEKVMGKNPSFFSAKGVGKERVKDRDTVDHPVERVSWTDAVEFCKKLSAKESKTYRLPTEAEWEYACRAGTSTVFHYGGNFNSNLGNINGLSYSSYGKEESGPFHRCTNKVGEYKPNAFGLFDMHGNVQEWCADWYGSNYYQSSPKLDPHGPADGKERVLRGGAWPSSAKACRGAARNHLPPDDRTYTTGFRVVLEAK
jgi:formylglycine-generating enzyme required for sulfatase activity